MTIPQETRKLADWIVEHLGPDVPLHFTAFHPDFKLHDKPRTPPETLHRARAIALEAGLRYVYEGNIHDGAGDTRCPACGALLIQRDPGTACWSIGCVTAPAPIAAKRFRAAGGAPDALQQPKIRPKRAPYQRSTMN